MFKNTKKLVSFFLPLSWVWEPFTLAPMWSRTAQSLFVTTIVSGHLWVHTFGAEIWVPLLPQSELLPVKATVVLVGTRVEERSSLLLHSKLAWVPSWRPSRFSPAAPASGPSQPPGARRHHQFPNPLSENLELLCLLATILRQRPSCV